MGTAMATESDKHQGQQERCVSVPRRQTGDASDHLFSGFSRLFAEDLPLQV
jgi:hypothetical protein